MWGAGSGGVLTPRYYDREGVDGVPTGWLDLKGQCPVGNPNFKGRVEAK